MDRNFTMIFTVISQASRIDAIFIASGCGVKPA
jgi:hypothetical protein